MQEVTNQTLMEVLKEELQANRELFKENTRLAVENAKLEDALTDWNKRHRRLEWSLSQADEAYKTLLEENEKLRANMDAMSCTMLANDETYKNMMCTNAFLSGKLKAYEKTGPLDQTTEGVQNEQSDRNA